MHLTREQLYRHHRLSFQQTDDWFGEPGSKNLLSEKLELMVLVKEFIVVSDQFQKVNCSFIPVKGPLLSYRIYKDAAYRRSKDLDLLIPFQDMGKAIALLREMGYQYLYYKWPEDEETVEFKKKLRNQYHLYNPEKELSIELHWKLFAYPSISEKEIEQLIKQNLCEQEFAGRKFTVLNPEFELVYLVIHGGLHAWRRLKWLVDVHEIVSRGLFDELKFIELVKVFKAERMVSLCNKILDEFYPGQKKLPEFKACPRFLVKHSQTMIAKEMDSEYQSFPELVSYFYFVFRAFPGIKYKVNTFRYLLNSLRDAGENSISFKTLIKSLLRPLSFVKNRYRLDER